MSMWNTISGLLSGGAQPHLLEEEQGSLQGRGVTRAPSDLIVPVPIGSVGSGQDPQVSSERERPSSLPFVHRDELQRHGSEEGALSLLSPTSVRDDEPSIRSMRKASYESVFSEGKEGEGVILPSPCFCRAGSGERRSPSVRSMSEEAQAAPPRARDSSATPKRRRIEENGSDASRSEYLCRALGWDESHKATLRQAIANELTDDEICSRFSFGEPEEMRRAVRALRSEFARQVDQAGSRRRGDQLPRSAAEEDIFHVEGLPIEPGAGRMQMVQADEGDTSFSQGKKAGSKRTRGDDTCSEEENSTAEMMESNSTIRGSRLWTEEEQHRLKTLFNNGYSDAVIARELGREGTAIQFRRLQLGLKRDDTRIRWSEEEVAILIKFIERGETDWQKIMDSLPGRNLIAIREKAKKLRAKERKTGIPKAGFKPDAGRGLTSRASNVKEGDDSEYEEENSSTEAVESKAKREFWTDEQVAILIDLYNKGQPSEKIALLVGKSVRAVTQKKSKLGLKAISPGKSWPEEEISQLRQLVEECVSHQEIAERLGRTLRSIEAKVTKLGLRSNSFWKPWEDEELSRGVANGETDKQIHETRLPHRKITAINARRNRLAGKK